MPRKYIRQTNRGSWSCESVTNALNAVRMRGVSVKAASERFGIPRSTLRDRLKGDGPVEETAAPRLGRAAIMSEEFEKDLAERVMYLSKVFYGVTTDKIASVAFEFAERQQINHRFNRTTRKAGRDWIKSFMRRNPEVTVRKPENLSLARIEAVNRKNLRTFFDNLAEIIGSGNFTPHRIFNVDETGLSAVVTGGKVVAAKGAKRVGRVASGERGKTTTAICCVSAAGEAVPPMLIFGGRKRLKPELLDGCPTGTVGGVSDNGWVSAELFLRWFEHFVSHVGPSPQRRFLLLMDNHSSHVSMELVCEARKHGVEIVTLPPHTSHILQPLDVAVYGPLKKAWHRQVQYHHDTHPGERICDGDVGKLFGRAYDIAVKTNYHSIISGFRSTGICPYNPDKVLSKDDVFVHNAVLATDDEETDINLEEQQGGADMDAGERGDDGILLHQGKSNVTSTPDASLRDPASADVGGEPTGHEQGPATPSSADVPRSPLPSSADVPRSPLSSSADVPRSPLSNSAGVSRSPLPSSADGTRSLLQDILPFPQVRRKKTMGKRRKRMSSVVLTSSPMKKMLEEQHNKKAKDRKEKEQKTKRKMFEEQGKKGKDKKEKEQKTESKRNKNRPAIKSADTTDNDICMYCREGVTGHNEAWLRCESCGGWAHEMCSNGSSSKGFICDLNCD